MNIATIAFSFTTVLGVSSAAAESFRLAPYKDELFQYARIIGELHDGDLIVVEFDDARDVGGRDEIRLKKAFDTFIDLSVNEAMQDLLIRRDGQVVQYLAVGKAEGDANIVVIYLHGQHGDRTLAMEDLRFGGNFNRLKNLMLLNDGVYLSPDFSSFGAKGTNEIKALMGHYAENAPEAPIVVACASTGCKIVWRLLEDDEAADLLDGVVLHGPLPLSTNQQARFFELDIFVEPDKAIPIYVGQGSADPTVPWVTQEIFLKNIKKAAPDYPIRYELFKGPDAVHGTPIRMMDWRLVLNWMLEQNEPDET